MNRKSIIIILIIIAVLSGIYYLMTGDVPLKEYIVDEGTTDTTSDIDQQTESLNEQANQDSLQSIEADLSNTDLGDLDGELLNIEEELNQL